MVMAFIIRKSVTNDFVDSLLYFLFTACWGYVFGYTELYMPTNTILLQLWIQYSIMMFVLWIYFSFYLRPVRGANYQEYKKSIHGVFK